MKSRIAGLRGKMDKNGLKALLVASPYNRKYMTGFTGTSGYALLTEDRALLFTDFRYMSQAKEQAHGWEVLEHGPKPMASIKEALAATGIEELGFEESQVSYSAYQSYAAELGGTVLKPAGPLVEGLRLIKDEGELQIMEQACQLADRTFAHILSKLKPGVTEREIALELEIYMRSQGASSSSFEIIVASGERSALPHGVASERKLGAGEFVKLDFGALYQGYCSDLTRTVMLGKPTDKHKEIYAIVLEAQMAALDGIKPGMTGREADALTRDIIKRYGYGDNFGHGTGHGLGLEIHEAPRLSLQGDVVLEPGMTVTVEPGIYVPGFGGVRIEDDVVVTDSGVRRLTYAPKDFTVLD